MLSITKKYFYFILIFIISNNAFCANFNSENSISLNSPDNNLTLIFELKEGVPTYNLTFKGEEIISQSKLDIVFKDKPTNHKYRIINHDKQSVDLKWDQPWGEFKTIHDLHNELRVVLNDQISNSEMILIFKLFNDGLGFRYKFPNSENYESSTSIVIADELTEFNFKMDHDVWWIPVHSENSFYESLYKKNKVSETDTINTPATFITKSGVHFAIHEANLTDFASMTLLKNNKSGYEANLVPWSNGDKVYKKLPFETPWRTIIVGDNAGDLATSSIILNLNEPCAITDTSWIKPSKYIGIWWGMHLGKYTWEEGPNHGATTINAKKYIDFASKHGFDGVLIEGWNKGWNGNWIENGNKFSFTESFPDFNLEEITTYAKANGVNIIGHHETAGSASNYENQIDEAYELYNNHNVKSIKTGYVNKFLDGKEWHDGQYGVNHYRRVIETAAKYKIMLDIHEPVKGTGLHRTYPNLMTQEGARGQEYDAWSIDGGNPPSHTTIVPFTRMLAGPFDFTPGTFDFNYETPNGAKVQTTLAKQLALFVTIYSPLQMASDLPLNYESNPAFEFIKDVPVSWSDTKILDSEIGQYVITARKDWNSDDWYMGVITNEEKRVVEIQLSFLDKDVTYEAKIFSDTTETHYKSNPSSIKIETRDVTINETLKLLIAPGGGAAIKITPKID